MEARLSAVQQRLLLVLAASIVLCVLVRPQLENAAVRDALRQLTTLDARYDREQAEQALRQQAQSKAALPLDALLAGLAQKRVPKLKLAAGGGSLEPLAYAELATLQQLYAYAQPAATLDVGLPELGALADSLAWRLARSQRSGTVTLASIELLPAPLVEADLEHERQVAALRAASLEARAKLEEGTRKVLAAERMVARRKKRSAGVRAEAVEKLAAAEQSQALSSQQHAEAQQRYEQAAQLAERPHRTQAARAMPALAVARVQLRHGKETLSYDVPVPVLVQAVPVRGLDPAQFAELHAAGLWNEVASLTPSRAKQAVEAHLSWHFQQLTLFGVALSGNGLLQLSSCVVPCLLCLLLWPMRRAEVGYNPFTTKVPSSLPRVGFKSRALEFVAVVVSPLCAVASAALSLLVIEQPPIFPALSACLCLLLGSVAFIKLRELRDLSSSIVRSHSIPPPL